MKTLLLALSSIAVAVSAQFALKAGMSSPAVRAAMADPLSVQAVFTILTNGFVVAGFALFTLGALIWLAVLHDWDVSKAYPLMSIGFALTAVVGFFLGEQVGAMRAVGIGLICLGAIVVGQS